MSQSDNNNDDDDSEDEPLSSMLSAPKHSARVKPPPKYPRHGVAAAKHKIKLNKHVSSRGRGGATATAFAKKKDDDQSAQQKIIAEVCEFFLNYFSDQVKQPEPFFDNQIIEVPLSLVLVCLPQLTTMFLSEGLAYEAMGILQAGLMEAQSRIGDDSELTLVRLIGHLPSEWQRRRICELRSSDVGCLIQITGKIIGCSESPSSRRLFSFYECTLCGCTFTHFLNSRLGQPELIVASQSPSSMTTVNSTSNNTDPTRLQRLCRVLSTPIDFDQWEFEDPRRCVKSECKSRSFRPLKQQGRQGVIVPFQKIQLRICDPPRRSAIDTLFRLHQHTAWQRDLLKRCSPMALGDGRSRRIGSNNSGIHGISSSSLGNGEVISVTMQYEMSKLVSIGQLLRITGIPFHGTIDDDPRRIRRMKRDGFFCPRMELDAVSMQVLSEDPSQDRDDQSNRNDPNAKEMSDIGESQEFQRYWDEHKDRPLLGRNRVVDSICPQLSGLAYAKLSIALSMIGSTPDNDSDNDTTVLSSDTFPSSKNCGRKRATMMDRDSNDQSSNCDDFSLRPIKLRRRSSSKWTVTRYSHSSCSSSSSSSSRGGRNGRAKKRSSIHVLMIGDPGTGKSQLATYVSEVCSPSVLTTGIGSTRAGLTMAAVRDESNEGGWRLEAGALLMAAGGICCIDEFQSLSKHDRAAMHGIMEQQRCVVNKAGRSADVECAVTVIAAMNPPNGYDMKADLQTNTGGIPTSLLSRFDIILLLLDKRSGNEPDSDDAWDSRLADRMFAVLKRSESRYGLMTGMLDGIGDGANEDIESVESLPGLSSASPSSIVASDGGVPRCSSSSTSSSSSFECRRKKIEYSEASPMWDKTRMRAYITAAKRKRPKFPESGPVTRLISSYFSYVKRKRVRDASRTTVRFADSMRRMCEAHARLCFRDEVLLLDAVEVVRLQEKSFESTNTLECSIELVRSAFPDQPDEEHLRKKKEIYERLGLSEED